MCKSPDALVHGPAIGQAGTNRASKTIILFFTDMDRGGIMNHFYCI
jgi:hypothetical protein